MAPFASASKMLGGQLYPTPPLVMPALVSIQRQLSDTNILKKAIAAAGNEDYVEETAVMMNDCRKAMLVLLGKRFNGLEDTEPMWVEFLDPRVGRHMSHLNPLTRERAVNACVELANQHGTNFDDDAVLLPQLRDT